MTPEEARAIEHLKGRALTLKLGLDQRLQELEVSDFATDTATRLAKLFADILKAAEAELADLEQERTVLLACVLFENLGYYLDFLEKADTNQAPRALIRMLESLSAELWPDELCIATPDPEFNYKIRDLLPALRDYTENFLPPDVYAEIFREFPAGLSVVLFPKTARDDVLMHAMFGHELGHRTATAFLDAEEHDSSSSYAAGLAAATEAVDLEIQEEFGDLTPIELFPEKQTMLQEVLEIRKRGLEEIIADSVAMLLLGPSALFALRDFLITERLDMLPEADDYYPPARSRLRHAFKLLERTGYIAEVIALRKKADDPVKQYLKDIEGITRETTDQDLIGDQSPISIAYKWVDGTLGAAIDYTIKAIGSAAYNPSLIRAEIPQLLERMEMRIPPNEIGTPPNEKTVDWRSGLLAAWIDRLSGRDMVDDGREVDAGERVRERQRLTLAAIDYVHLQRDYAAAMASTQEEATGK